MFSLPRFLRESSHSPALPIGTQVPSWLWKPSEQIHLKPPGVFMQSSFSPKHTWSAWVHSSTSTKRTWHILLVFNVTTVDKNKFYVYCTLSIQHSVCFLFPDALETRHTVIGKSFFFLKLSLQSTLSQVANFKRKRCISFEIHCKGEKA